jgi:hypothetical protein
MLFGIILYSIRTIGPSLEEAKKKRTFHRPRLNITCAFGFGPTASTLSPGHMGIRREDLGYDQTIRAIIVDLVRVPNEKEK